MKRIFLRRGQNLTELALIIGVVGLVLIGMEVYFKRGVAAKIKDLTDGIIGDKQAVYQQDTSGLLVNISNSTIIADTNTTFTKSLGGGKETVGTEDTSITYYSETSDEPNKINP